MSIRPHRTLLSVSSERLRAATFLPEGPQRARAVVWRADRTLRLASASRAPGRPLTLAGPTSKVRRSKSSVHAAGSLPRRSSEPGARSQSSIHGAVAQLGERRVRNAKVGGSIPLGSTIQPSAAYAKRAPPIVFRGMGKSLAERSGARTRGSPGQVVLPPGRSSHRRGPVVDPGLRGRYASSPRLRRSEAADGVDRGSERGVGDPRWTSTNRRVVPEIPIQFTACHGARPTPVDLSPGL